MTCVRNDSPKSAILDAPEAQALLAAMRAASNVLLTTHEGPDGDGIGSELALAKALRRLGKRVSVVNPGPTVKRFAYMDRDSDIKVFKPAFAPEVREADLALLVDTCELRRTGPLEELLASRPSPAMAIDHHPRTPGTVEGVMGTDFSSTGELMVHVIRRLGVPITTDIADLLYAAILFDTNQFRFVRNDPEVFRVSADLVEAGANAEDAGRRLFGQFSADRMVLLGRVLTDARFELGGRLAWGSVGQATTAGLHVDRDDVRGMVMALGDIEGVEVALLFRNTGEGRTKISLRSRGSVTINDIAESFGGGGHPFAAGVDLECDIPAAEERVLPLVRSKLSAAT